MAEQVRIDLAPFKCRQANATTGRAKSLDRFVLRIVRASALAKRRLKLPRVGSSSKYTNESGRPAASWISNDSSCSSIFHGLQTGGCNAVLLRRDGRDSAGFNKVSDMLGHGLTCKIAPELNFLSDVSGNVVRPMLHMIWAFWFVERLRGASVPQLRK